MLKQLKHFNNLVNILESLPSIGKKSAQRLAYYLSIENKYTSSRLSECLENVITNVRLCENCNCISERSKCDICQDAQRNTNKLCIVDSPRDVFLLEQSNCYDGRYFVVTYPLQDNIEKLMNAVNGVSEVIFALSSSVQNDSLILYIEDKLSNFDIVFSQIATGVPAGVKLENVDILSISKALSSRVDI